MSPPLDNEGFAIGAVAQIVGVPVDTLRTWERRYGLPTPAREKGGRRHYSSAEVEQLRLVAQLAQQGERVRDLAHLDLAGLQQRLALHGGPSPEAAPASAALRVAVVQPHPGPDLSGLTPSRHTRIQVVAAGPRLQDLPVDGPIDALVVPLGALGPDPIAALDARPEALREATVLVVASYTASALRARLEAHGVRVLDEATRLAALRQQLEDAVLAQRLLRGARPVRRAPTAPIYARAELEQLLNTPSRLRCECPAHLAALVLRLREFERYSRQCATDTPQDAALHADLAEGTATAAADLEALLALVCAQEPPLSPAPPDRAQPAQQRPGW